MGDASVDAAAIWQAALEAVAPPSLVERRLACDGDCLLLDGRPLVPFGGGRVVVVGGGKAAAGLAVDLARLLGRAGLADRLTGLVSVPEGLCGTGDAGPIAIRGTRPAGVNLPTPAAVNATAEMLAMLGGLGPGDLAIALVTGGGSACLAAPRQGLSLAEKVAVTRFLAAAGADIRSLNVVRQAASAVKGGGLARACTADRMIALVISDIVGDPLDLIASGPCLPVPPRAAVALEILARHGALQAGICPTLVRLLEEDLALRDGWPPTAVGAIDARDTTPHSAGSLGGCRVEHVLLGSNATAVAAAAARARSLGYDVAHRVTTDATETADDVGARLAGEGVQLWAAACRDGRPRAIVEGGEAVVRLPAEPGLGGRNQQTAVAALVELWRAGRGWPAGLVVASIGTDGEDGPTAAAGGVASADVAARIGAAGLDPTAAMDRCDAHPLLEATGGLVVTGPTGTNVADVRIVLARP